MDLQDQIEIEASRGVPDASPRAVHGAGHHLQGEKDVSTNISAT